MIRHIRIHLGTALFLSCSVNALLAGPLPKTSDEAKVRVAFLGIQFDGLPEKLREKIQNDFLAMFQLEPAFEVVSPEQVEQRMGKERVEALVKEFRKDSAMMLCGVLDVQYVFAGTISNQSEDSGQVIVSGAFHRGDAAGMIYSYSILKYYQNFHEDLKVIKEQLITTIVPVKRSIVDKWPFLVVAGLALVGILLLFFGTGKAGGDGEPPPEPTPT